MAFLVPVLPAIIASPSQQSCHQRPLTMLARKRKPPRNPKPSSPSPSASPPSDAAPPSVPSDNDGPQSVQYSTADDLPVVDESRLRLPDAPASSGGAGVRRRRRKRSQESEDIEEVAVEVGDGDREVDAYGISELGKGSNAPDGEVDRSAVDAVRRLTSDFRMGSASAEDLLLREIEKDPDFLFQTGNATDEYDLTSALIGTGTPNKQGVYVNPYVQSGHVLLLVVILLCAFVYYPGFPLTELDIETTDWLKRGLALTYVFNLGLSFFSYREAKKRNQPPFFWAAKTAFIGGLAFSELRANAPTDEEKKKRSAGRKKKRAAK